MEVRFCFAALAAPFQVFWHGAALQEVIQPMVRSHQLLTRLGEFLGSVVDALSAIWRRDKTRNIAGYFSLKKCSCSN
jgi:hypothetical protein